MTPGAPRRGARTAASDRVRVEWLRRVEAEYGSAAVTQHLTLWLIQIGASPDLIRAGLAIVGDELRHASMSHRTFLSAGGAGGPALAREALGLVRDGSVPLERDVVRVCVETFCLGETVAVPLFSALRRGCTAPRARATLDRVLRDEVRHRDFGWQLLAWLLEQPSGAAGAGWVRAELPSMFARLRRSYGPSEATDPRPLGDEERAWGLMEAGRYAEILERAVARDYAPRFGALGIDARAAWTASS